MSNSITFVDLFCGIGGFHQTFASLGAECVFACDYDKSARQTYSANYGFEPFGDIRELEPNILPDFDILCAGFPCQPFSIAGVSKKISLGRKHGFEDEKQGNLFFELLKIIQNKRPKVLFLENVKNLKSHDKGNTWNIIERNLISQGYYVFAQIVDAKYFVPQHRERIFIVCFDRMAFPDIFFEFPAYPKQRITELRDIIEEKVDKKYTLSDKLWQYLQKHKENSARKGNGFGYGLVDLEKDEITRTMSARYYKDGSEILIKQSGENPRRLTPNEARKLFGYPSDFVISVSDCQVYKQFGNTVVVPAIKHVAEQILKTLDTYNKGGARVRYIQQYLLMEEEV
ncbi:MAG: DNA (cytosine-5-)-methyltransferase [Oscillospiraceae bacterium]|nr:DNA (cytosine-5-)-methyltransferase [Oscillospiraceae bacterium]